MKNLLDAIEYLDLCVDPDVDISGIAFDSRQVRAGDLFIAIVGTQDDGHNYIDQAIERGAAAVIGQRARPGRINYIRVADSRIALADLAAAFYDHPTRGLFTVGVTGTNGKTTVVHLLGNLLDEQRTAQLSTILNAIGPRPIGLGTTTPESVEIQERAREALEAGKENLALEVSSHALTQGRVRGIDFDAAIFTNLTQDHFDYHRDWEGYLNAKLKLFTQYLNRDSWAIINGDDRWGDRFSQQARGQVLRYGIDGADLDLRAEAISLDMHGSWFVARTPQGRVEIETKLPGKFNIYNTLAAIGVGLIRGIPVREVRDRIVRVTHIEGRFEILPTRTGFTVIIDFAHTPDALQQIIGAIKPSYRRVITVFGAGGESDRIKRPIMAQVTGRLSDHTIVTSDNPKGEDPEAIVREVVAGFAPDDAYEAIVDRRAAIRRALELAEPGDAVLIAGKGHERTQIFKDREIVFNDKVFLQEEGII